jgi:hypothetical protein
MDLTVVDEWSSTGTGASLDAKQGLVGPVEVRASLPIAW